MNGKRKRFLSFVGAMKIARHPRILVSTPMNGKTYPPRRTRKNHPPAGKTSSGRVIDIMGEVAPGSLMLVTAQNFRDNNGLRINHWPGGTIGRHSLSFAALSSSLKEGAGKGCTIHCIARKPQGYGRFSSPLRNSEDITFLRSLRSKNEKAVSWLWAGGRLFWAWGVGVSEKWANVGR